MNSPVEVVEAINTAWRTGRTDDLASSFAPEMLIVGPGSCPLLTGVMPVLPATGTSCGRPSLTNTPNPRSRSMRSVTWLS